MKKIIISILAVLYLSCSIGATIHFHYCMGKLVNWNLRHKPSDRCGRCGMKISHQSKSNGCCKDEYKQLKSNKDQKLSQANLLIIHPVCLAPSVFQAVLLTIFHSTIAETRPVSNSPPRSGTPIHIRNCIFRI